MPWKLTPTEGDPTGGWGSPYVVYAREHGAVAAGARAQPPHVVDQTFPEAVYALCGAPLPTPRNVVRAGGYLNVPVTLFRSDNPTACPACIEALAGRVLANGGACEMLDEPSDH